ncbi:hypothetical protein HK097_006176 [Rhizophlyctis rosea]|uniref:SF3 helicase domain-containing protein n=1 Tax=Rhizophlyctis rosea TaxID=64517 RepID=A0AAD5SM31_9FUNG|nr:hypothetical protein HK097_006176 [Rhizophlyctis rosea]
MKSLFARDISSYLAVQKAIDIVWAKESRRLLERALPQVHAAIAMHDVDLMSNTLISSLIDKVADDLMEEAKKECRGNIMKNFHREEEKALIPMQDLDSLTTQLHQHPCPMCDKRALSVEHRGASWIAKCTSCDAVWPDAPVSLPAERYPKLTQVLNQLNLTINVVNNVNNVNNVTTVNNYNGTGSALEYHADFSHDGLCIFEDDEENRLFVGSLQGTDMRLSQYAVYHFRNRFHCSKTSKRWFEFRGHCWHEDDADVTYKEALGEASFLQGFYRAASHFENHPIQTDEVKRKAKALRKLCVCLEDGKFRERIVTDSIAKFDRLRPNFEKRCNGDNIMVFTDGVFNFDTMSFGPGSPDIPVTMCVEQPFIPFDPDNEHVRFLLHFLEDILPDPGVRTYTLKVLGLSLTLDTSQQYFFVWTGSGGNGKGRLLGLMEKCLGVYYQSIGPTFLTSKREDVNQANEALMSLRTTRLAVFQEPESTDTLQAGIIKSLTGEDTISTRENYGHQVKFTPRNKSLLVCNEIPNVSESTLAFWRRFRVTHFPNSFVENPVQPHERKIDYQLTKKLDEAAPYFIGILINYLAKYKSEGLPVPTAVATATDKYKDSVDKVKEFVEEHMSRSENEKHVLEWKDVASAFAKHYGKMKRDTLRAELAKHGVNYANTSVDGDKFKGFLGWALT